MINKSTKQAFYFCLTALVASGCSSSSSESGISEVDLRFSDAPVDSASEVVITVDRITFRPVGDGDDVVVDLFNGELTNEQVDTNAGNDNKVDQAAAANTDTDFSGTDTYTIDLLTVQGNDSRLVLDDVQLPVGDYANMLIDVIDEGIETISYSPSQEITGIGFYYKLKNLRQNVSGFTWQLNMARCTASFCIHHNHKSTTFYSNRYQPCCRIHSCAGTHHRLSMFCVI